MLCRYVQEVYVFDSAMLYTYILASRMLQKAGHRAGAIFAATGISECYTSTDMILGRTRGDMVKETKTKEKRKMKIQAYKRTATKAKKALRKDWTKTDLKLMIQWKRGPFAAGSEALSKLDKPKLEKLWKDKYSKAKPPAIKWTGMIRKSMILLFDAVC